MLQEKVFPANDITINYAEGPASGPPLVLVHGLTGRWQGLHPLISALTPMWHIYACDLRGHGKSGRLGDQYRLTDYAQDLAAFLRDVVREPAVLVGHSLGALTILAAVPLGSDQMRALVLLDPPLYNRNTSIDATPYFKGWFHWVLETMKSAPTYEEVVAKVRALAPDADEALLKEMADTVYHVAPSTVEVALQDRIFEGFDVDRALQQIQCPLLLLQGEWQRGAAMRDEDATFVQTHVPHAVIRKFSEAGHQLHQEQTEAVVQAMSSFLHSAA